MWDQLPRICFVVYGLAAVLVLTTAPAKPQDSLLGADDRNLGASIFADVTWNARSLVTVIVTFTVSALANAGGIGGGGFLVPLFNLVLGLSLKGSMALSQAAITGGAVAAGVFAVFSSHPLDRSKSLLDLDTAMVVMPSLLFGVSLGVTLNQIFPDWVLVILLSVLLVLLSVRTLQKGLNLHRQEAQDHRADAESMLMTASSEIPSMASLSGRGTEASEAQFLMPATPTPNPQMPALGIRRQGSEMLVGNVPDDDASEGNTADSNASQSRQVILYEDDSSPSSAAGSTAPSLKVTHVDTLIGKANDVGERLKALAEYTLPHEPPSFEALSEKAQKLEAQDLEAQDLKPKHDERGQTLVLDHPFQDASETHGEAQKKQRLFAALSASFKLGLLILTWAGFLALQIVKTHFLTCSRNYFILYGAQAALCVLSTALFLTVWMKHSRKGANDIEEPLLRDSAPLSKQMSGLKLMSGVLAVLLGGCISALCGLGGGMILGPVLLELGLDPLVTASTSLLLVGASSSSATVGFALANRLDYGWGIIMFLICIVASIIGVAGIGGIVRKSRKASIVVFLLVFVMAAGGILTAVFGGIDSVRDLRHGGRMGFLNLCKI